MDVPGSAAQDRDVRPYGRRAFLGTLGVGVTSLWWGDAASRSLSDVLSPITDKAPQALKAALPSPSQGWRIYAVNPPMPRFDPASWQLRIDGLVENPLTLTYDDLRGRSRADQVSDFHCVTGWSVLDVAWGGVRLSELIAEARPARNARALAFVSAEQPYFDTLTLEQAALSDVMLAYDMDGVPLTRPHGAPLRLVMPQMYGYKGTKWLERIVVLPEEPLGYWEQRGYDTNAWVDGRA